MSPDREGTGLEVDVHVAFRSFDLQVEQAIPAAGVTAVFGPSGSGKTTLLRSLLGFETGSRGRIALNGDVWLDSEAGVDVPPHRRPVGCTFQDGRLFPHLDVAGNLRYAERRSAEASAVSITHARCRGRPGPGAASRPAAPDPVGRRAPAGRPGAGAAQPAAPAASRRAPFGTRPTPQGGDHAVPAGAASAFRHSDPLCQPRGRRGGAPGGPRPGPCRGQRAGVRRHGRSPRAARPGAAHRALPGCGRARGHGQRAGRRVPPDLARPRRPASQRAADRAPRGRRVGPAAGALPGRLARHRTPVGDQHSQRAVRQSSWHSHQDEATAFAEATVDLGSHRLRARITRASAAELGLAVGSQVFALLKSVSLDTRAGR